MKKLIATLIVGIAVAGCGAATSQTAATADCFSNALSAQALANGSHNSYGCDGSAAATSVHVSCTHRSANNYGCNVTGSATETLTSGAFPLIAGGSYDVVYDRKSITYRPSQYNTGQ